MQTELIKEDELKDFHMKDKDLCITIGKVTEVIVIRRGQHVFEDSRDDR
jgi:chemotaxis signal transduction protein